MNTTAIARLLEVVYCAIAARLCHCSSTMKSHKVHILDLRYFFIHINDIGDVLEFILLAVDINVFLSNENLELVKLL